MNLDGVLNVSVITRIGQATVTFDESKVTLDQMIAALGKKGFAVTGRYFVQ
jgi:copper chaperone CopZ